MNKKAIVDQMVLIGLDPSLMGFWYLVDAIEIAEDMPCNFMVLYDKIGSMHYTSKANVERGIRTLVNKYYATCKVHEMLMQDKFKGAVPVSTFIYRLRELVSQNVGFLSDGSQWVMYRKGDLFEVRIYVAGGNYAACLGTRRECEMYIKERMGRNVI